MIPLKACLKFPFFLDFLMNFVFFVLNLFLTCFHSHLICLQIVLFHKKHGSFQTMKGSSYRSRVMIETSSDESDVSEKVRILKKKFALLIS